MYILAALFALASDPDTVFHMVVHDTMFPTEQACKAEGEKDVPALRSAMAGYVKLPETDIIVKIVCKLDGRDA